LFNDVADVNFDREHRPERPIPSGRVPRGQVGGAAAVLMLCGTAAFLLLGNYFSIFLPLVILVYTYIHKTIPPAGLLFMASCRLLLAITVSFSVPDMQLALTGIIIPNDTPAPQFWWWTLFAYICALSWLAQGEKRPWRRKTVGVMLAALPLLDAVFMLGGGQGMLPLVPVACAAMAWGLRRVASAT
jgi:4-hydroxybenzoate polyprenyltransferase